MRIKWNGHASFTITTSDGIKIITARMSLGGSAEL
jgi:L-ascorbate metabolism protein UlaG (beta-lactamase superfamily)